MKLPRGAHQSHSECPGVVAGGTFRVSFIYSTNSLTAGQGSGCSNKQGGLSVPASLSIWETLIITEKPSAWGEERL